MLPSVPLISLVLVQIDIKLFPSLRKSLKISLKFDMFMFISNKPSF
jgi:hypothetical protein